MVEVDNWLWLFNVVRYFILMWLHKRIRLISKDVALVIIILESFLFNIHLLQKYDYFNALYLLEKYDL